MISNSVVLFDNYTPVGDILVMAIVIVFAILVKTAVINRSVETQILKGILCLLFAAAAFNVIFHLNAGYVDTIPHILLYVTRFLYHLCLFLNLFLYVLYMGDPLHVGDRLEKKYHVLSGLGVLAVCAYDILGSIYKFGFYITEDNEIHKGFEIFHIGYIYFAIMLMYMIVSYKSKVFRPILFGLTSTCAVSFIVMFIQSWYAQSSFTTATFLFPAYAVMYLLHGNPFDVEMGSAHVDAFDSHIKHSNVKNNELVMMSLYVHEFDEVGKKLPKEIRDRIRKYTEGFFKNATAFLVSEGRIILVAPTEKNPDYKDKIKAVLDLFEKDYSIFQQDYKIVITTTYEEISRHNEYINLIQYIEARMPENDIRYVKEEDLKAYADHKYIVEQLADINEKHDLHDPRVVVFCQPVYNMTTGKFDTSESLMRLKLEMTGMVFPDKFIPIAEQHNYIHMLSLIILAKTCDEIRKLMDEGYFVRRISVNFSMMDVRESHFCFNVNQIVQDSGIPYDKIAIEITESQNESDFKMVKEKIFELKESGMVFYLDDFGTGYSNFERIMELPFDIIKFDRSLVIASGLDKKSETMVSYLAHMFTDMNYSVLYEGIEDDNDEERCANMCARYLQGYKYSKPIPIEKLNDFFEKKEKTIGA